MWSALKRGETWQGELCNRRKDGRCFWERATIAPLKEADGRTMHFIALKEEITARQSADDEARRMEEQLSQVQKMETLGALAGGIAHDFNNILTAIIGHTELAAELAPPPHPAAECMRQVRQASRRASDLVQRILSFSHRGPSDRVKLNLGHLVAEVIPLLRASIPSTIKVDLSIASNDLTVLANSTDIQQIVLNLGGNAAHAMRERGGLLHLSIEPCHFERPLKTLAGTMAAGDYLRLRVSDTGSGISPQVMTRIFEPFFTTKPSGEGTGLGLSIVLGIVLAHSGGIDVQSAAGQGTSFDVYLPSTAADPVEEPKIEPPKLVGTGQRIAFVDDEVPITLIARNGLAMRGYRPLTFDRAQALIDYFSAGCEPFDLIITDYTMPGMTGLELIRYLRESGNQTPIIILSGNARYVSKEDLAGLGQVQFMPKPFELSELVERISLTLGPRS
jgi:signal transduction histidine kinase/CheY-like chemotaxis protein